MRTDRGGKRRHVTPDDKPKLHVRARARRNRVHRTLRIARLEGQDFKRIPAEYAFGRRQPRLAPIGIDRRTAGLTGRDVSERARNGRGNGRRS